MMIELKVDFVRWLIDVLDGVDSENESWNDQREKLMVALDSVQGMVFDTEKEEETLEIVVKP